MESPLLLSRHRGFSLLEVLFVGAIISILVAVALPAYMRYFEQARVVSYVLPGVHLIETEVMFHYLATNALPDDTVLRGIAEGADTRYFTVSSDQNALVFTIRSPDLFSKLHQADGESMVARPDTSSGRIIKWSLEGKLAERLGISY